VESSALPEQVTRDVISSAFQSAGQRCSALRVLFVQEDVADGMIRMIAGAMEALNVGDPADLSTDVGPVIDGAAKKVLDEHLEWLDKNARKICRLEPPKEAANGCFVPPAFYEIQSLSQLNQENFGAILHVIRFAGDKLDKVVEAINATGYGLTIGLQSRIDTVRDYVEEHARVGNLYVNRNQIGAVVESQPFGGEGLSGTGPKAGGPHYVARFAIERVTCIDTTAAGGNASLMASIDGYSRETAQDRKINGQAYCGLRVGCAASPCPAVTRRVTGTRSRSASSSSHCCAVLQRRPVRTWLPRRRSLSLQTSLGFGGSDSCAAGWPVNSISANTVMAQSLRRPEFCLRGR
jgi:delta 1-pyrroline-5-carboxylate dehydrogenase